jgi:toxin ParE1/3/4
VRIEITDAAEADLADLYAYYAERSGPAADQVLGAILQAINGLASFPLMGKPGEVPETRERVVTRYPYRIVYYVNQHTQSIEVWRVMHTALQWPPPNHME